MIRNACRVVTAEESGVRVAFDLFVGDEHAGRLTMARDAFHTFLCDLRLGIRDADWQRRLVGRLTFVPIRASEEE